LSVVGPDIGALNTAWFLLKLEETSVALGSGDLSLKQSYWHRQPRSRRNLAPRHRPLFVSRLSPLSLGRGGRGFGGFGSR
jgi:hypothetical protein